MRCVALGWWDTGFLADWSDAIVAIAERRDKESFRALFLYFAPRLKSFYLRLGASDATAEDLAQEVMFTVWNKSFQFEPGRAAASTWIFTIARHLRIDHLRRERKPPSLPEVSDVPAEITPCEHMLCAEREGLVRDALAGLPAEQVNVIRLSFFEDLPHREIADALDIPLGTVKSRVRLALSRLRAMVKDSS